MPTQNPLQDASEVLTALARELQTGLGSSADHIAKINQAQHDLRAVSQHVFALQSQIRKTGLGSSGSQTIYISAGAAAGIAAGALLVGGVAGYGTRIYMESRKKKAAAKAKELAAAAETGGEAGGGGDEEEEEEEEEETTPAPNPKAKPRRHK